jgi:hypothetical protein
MGRRLDIVIPSGCITTDISFASGIHANNITKTDIHYDEHCKVTLFLDIFGDSHPASVVTAGQGNSRFNGT